MLLFATKTQGPVQGHDDVYRTEITGRRTVLRLTLGWLGWEPEIRFRDEEFRVYNAPAGWGIGFMRPWLPAEYRVFTYDGVAMHSLSCGWFRINWSRWARDIDVEREERQFAERKKNTTQPEGA